MDRTVISVDKLVRLQNISNLSAIVLVESDAYIELARAIELYVSDITSDHFISVVKALEACAKRVPTFRDSREQLMSLLISNGTITRAEPSDHTPAVEDSPPTPPTTPISSNNVINLADFRKKNVDNPK